MLNGKLSALRWVIGDEWDMLDTLPKLADSPLEEAVRSEPVSETGFRNNARFRGVYSTVTAA
jgi:hypothetical protein